MPKYIVTFIDQRDVEQRTREHEATDRFTAAKKALLAEENHGDFSALDLSQMKFVATPKAEDEESEVFRYQSLYPE